MRLNRRQSGRKSTYHRRTPMCQLVPGLYVIGHNHTYNGLEIGRIYVYVGKTDNLRRRLGEHAPDTEENSGLRKYLRQWIGQAMCWYTIMDKSALNKGERELIRKLQPCYNRRGK